MNFFKGFWQFFVGDEDQQRLAVKKERKPVVQQQHIQQTEEVPDRTEDLDEQEFDEFFN